MLNWWEGIEKKLLARHLVYTKSTYIPIIRSRVGGIGLWMPIISDQITIMSNRRYFFPDSGDLDCEWS